MKELLLDNDSNNDNIKNNDNILIKSDNIRKISRRNMRRHSRRIQKTMRQIKKVNKLHRYKIGLIFFSIYLLVDIAELILTILTEYDFDYDPFCETYIRYSSFVVFLFVAPFLNRGNSSLFDIINITKYYVPDWKKKKSGNLSSVFYVFEGTEEKFNKTVHKMSFLFTVLVYLSMSFYLHSYIEASKDIRAYVVPILFPMGSVLIIIFLRKYFLHTQALDLLSKISVILISISVIFLIIFQYSIFKDKQAFEIFGFSLIGGVFFGVFSTFLKYYSNVYGENFRLTSVIGYIGIFTLITVPLLICLICLFNNDLDKHFNLFSVGNNMGVYIILFITNFIKFFCTFHCIISLSPLVFSISIFFLLLLNLLINIFWGYIESHWTFYVAGAFLILGVAGGILDKYLKNSIKSDKTKKEMESDNEILNLGKNDDDDAFEDNLE